MRDCSLTGRQSTLPPKLRQHAGGRAFRTGDRSGGFARQHNHAANADTQRRLGVQTPDDKLRYDRKARIDGVPGTSAPITISFLDMAGSIC
jgi:2-methylaconitate cis-trans-isomerase PrpF